MVVYNIGDIITGKVVSITKYGAFLKLESDYTGLVHISEISNDYVHSIDHYVQVEDEVTAIIIDIDPSKKQLKLSFKGLNPEMKPIYRNKIIDTKHGFESLALNLPKWIEKKIKNND